MWSKSDIVRETRWARHYATPDGSVGYFESRFMDDLLARVDKTVTVVEKLDQLLSQVRKDCE